MLPDNLGVVAKSSKVKRVKLSGEYTTQGSATQRELMSVVMSVSSVLGVDFSVFVPMCVDNAVPKVTPDTVISHAAVNGELCYYAWDGSRRDKPKWCLPPDLMFPSLYKRPIRMLIIVADEGSEGAFLLHTGHS